MFLRIWLLTLPTRPQLTRGECLRQTLSPPEPDATGKPLPLCVDLDGTLVTCNTLVDSVLVLLRSRPVLALSLFIRVFRGKAAFKAFVTESVTLDVTHLPYNGELLQFLKVQHSEGRLIYLATGADVRLARRVAEHLKIFTDVLGSDGVINLTGNNKLASVRARLGSTGFDYVGNDTPDLPLLADARHPMVANPSSGLRAALRSRGIQPVRVFEEPGRSLLSMLRAVRSQK